MSSTGHGPRPEDPEDDPTGVRELLSALPDPGPMPEDLAARITASLDEHAQRGQMPSAPAGSVSPVVGPASRTGLPEPLARVDGERDHGRAGPRITAAAAVVAVGVVGAVLYEQMARFGDAPNVATQYISTQGNSAEESSATDSLTESSASADDVASAVARVDERTFASGAAAVLEGARAGTAPVSLPPTFDAIDGEVRALPARETENCVRATGETPAGTGWVATPATVAETDVVVVSDRDAPTPRAWAVSPDCLVDSSAAVLHGPTDLP